jgi:hypothetical protein
MIKKNSWVRIHDIVLKSELRAPQVPDDTKKVPLELWTKGYLNHDANIGDKVEITTITGRITTGTLLEVDPYYTHNYGKFVPELLKIGKDLKEYLYGGNNE